MTKMTNPNVAGGIGVLIIDEKVALPVTNIFRFSSLDASEGNAPSTRIFLIDQASGTSQYGSVYGNREYVDVTYSLSDVAVAFNVASRGHIIVLDDFCAKLQEKRKGKVISLTPAKKINCPSQPQRL